MDYSQKVKVVTQVTTNGAEKSDEFEGVGHIRISDGHLSLMEAKFADITIAAYAPGQWKRFKRQTKE